MLLHDKLQSYRLILASGSPRRRQLLTDSGFEFECAPRFDCDERYPASLPTADVAAYLSQLKSHACPLPLSARDILLTADTVVIVDDTILGKPASEAHACQMLRMLSGREHKVVTGVTLRSAEQQTTFSVESRVRFRALTAEEIAYYVATFRPLDKAGAYGIQEWIGYVGIEGISGSFYNVMGLPVQRLYTALDEFCK